jgi:hypothetical protein
MRVKINLPCLTSDSEICIRKSVVPGRYYFVCDDELKGYFRKAGNYWLWHKGSLNRYYKSLDELFEDAGKLLNEVQ